MADDDLPVRGSLVIPGSELSWRFSRSGGPGGQSVNTSDSRASVSFDVAASPSLSPLHRKRALERLANRVVDGVLTVTADEERSQYLNRRAARRRLAQLLATAVAPPPRPRRPTKPSRTSVERRLSGKRRRSDLKRTRRNLDD
ncbi:MAG TPA: alternative ribosome rescue aminoacyl-tRNA hydrolase ArfB [Actinomycetes bacterium]|nr:alternative ribosome rescue aminoacyl-tRNA hydrolase ArfB [Actinomycetes bacterium]